MIDLPEDERQEAASQAAHFDAAGLVHMIALLENLQRHAKGSSNPRALLDATLVRLALAERMADVTALLAAGHGGGGGGGGGGWRKKRLTLGRPTGRGGGVEAGRAGERRGGGGGEGGGFSRDRR